MPKVVLLEKVLFDSVCVPVNVTRDELAGYALIFPFSLLIAPTIVSAVTTVPGVEVTPVNTFEITDALATSEATPVKLAVIVPAPKFPDASLLTILSELFSDVALLTIVDMAVKFPVVF